MKPDTRNRILYMAADWLMTSVGWMIFNVVRYFTLDEPVVANSLPAYLVMPNVVLGQILFPLMLLAIYAISGYYNKVFSKSRIDSIVAAFVPTLVGSFVIYLVAIYNDPIPDRLSNFTLIMILFGLLFGGVALGRLIVSSILLRLRGQGITGRSVLVIGTGETIHDCIDIFNRNNPTVGLRIVAAIPLDDSREEGVGTYYTTEDLVSNTFDDVDMFILAFPEETTAQQMKLLRHLYRHDKPIYRADWYQHPWPTRSRVTNVAGAPITDISSVVIGEGVKNVKRIMDVILSSIALVVLSPLMLGVAVAVKLNDGGPVIFSQERVGRRGKKFRIYKFRTMVEGAEANGPELSHDNDPRVTRPGRFLRKYRIDELPQFWNVIKGDMSLVGPRPEREYYEEQIMQRAPEYAMVHQMRPGITSWGMVKYGYASDIESMIRRMRYDIIYLENVSIAIDLKIMFYTINTVFTGKGV